MLDPIRHAKDCPAPVPHRTVGRRLGEPMTRCRNCGRFALDSETPRPRPQEAAPAVKAPQVKAAAVPVVVTPTGRPALVCRDHHKPVTWKGSGCPSCDVERAERIATRERKRQEAQRRKTAADA